MRLSQRQFAERLGVSPESYRAWDCGRRETPVLILNAATQLIRLGGGDAPLSLPALARILGISVLTLRHAARVGRLEVSLDTHAALGKPILRATRSAGDAFKARYYRQTTRWTRPLSTVELWPVIPADFDRRLVRLRTRLRLSQGGLAKRIGAAGKAVIYQWESRKRKPSAILWRRVVALDPLGSRNSALTVRSESSVVPGPPTNSESGVALMRP